MRSTKLRAPLVLLLMLSSTAASAATRHVALTGSDAGNDCTSAPCRTISHGIAAMASGDTLLIGDGTYTDPITDMPSGAAGAYTTVAAEHDWGVVIDGSAWPNTFMNGISVSAKSYVRVRGFKVKMSQANENNEPISVPNSDHVKIERCAGSYGPTTGNAATFDIGPRSSYVLVEESYAFGGSRYQFLVYQSDHVVVRRAVARSDYWNGTLQCAGFVNYDSVATAWQNDIVLDSDTANCSGRLFGGFFSENKTDYAPDTSQALAGNIVLNVQAFYAGDLDWVTSGTRTLSDMVIWGSSGGYYGDQGDGLPASINATRMTIGGISGTYDGPNGGAAEGTGFSIYGAVSNTLTNSVLASCHSLGVADYTSSDYNAFAGNGANYGGHHAATAGAHDRCSENGNAVDVLAASLRYLPRIEPGSPLATAGQGGGQIGAQIVYQIGGSGTLHGEPGWDTPSAQLLWPFPNEDQIGKDMAAYAGPGAPGARGFATGNSRNGTPQTLTKYVWEYLGNEIPPEIYSARDAGTPGAGAPGAGSPGAGAPDAGAGGSAAESGCGCRLNARAASAGLPLLGALGALLLARRLRRR
jgi:hypothetical protein